MPYGDFGSILDDDRERVRRNEPVFNAIATARNQGYNTAPLEALIQRSGFQVPQRQGQSFFPGANVNQFALSLDPRNATQGLSFNPEQYRGAQAPRPTLTPEAPAQPGFAPGSFANAAAAYGRGIQQPQVSRSPFIANGLQYPAGSPFPAMSFTAPVRQPTIAPPPIQANIPDPYGYISMARAQSRFGPNWTKDEWNMATGGGWSGY